MSLSTEPWSIDRHDKVAKIARSLSQDVGKRFKEDVLGKLYPKKMVDGEDIGKVCCEWTYVVLTDFEEKELQKKLLKMIRLAYKQGKNLNKWQPWLDYISMYGVQSFSDKINKFAQIAKLSFMDSLEKKEKMRDITDVQW